MEGRWVGQWWGQHPFGEYGCYTPGWSPDGTHIIFTRADDTTERIYMAKADGTDVVQVTDGTTTKPCGEPPAAERASNSWQQRAEDLPRAVLEALGFGGGWQCQCGLMRPAPIGWYGQ